jgi:hypothetical protein
VFFAFVWFGCSWLSGLNGWLVVFSQSVTLWFVWTIETRIATMLGTSRSGTSAHVQEVPAAMPTEAKSSSTPVGDNPMVADYLLSKEVSEPGSAE